MNNISKFILGNKNNIDFSRIIHEQNDENLYLDDTNKYKMVRTKKSLLTTGIIEDKYYIIDSSSPKFQINQWLDTKNSNINTSKKYANILTRFLNYIYKYKKKYWQVTNNDIINYLLYRIYDFNDNVSLIKSNKRYKTIYDDALVIKMFYTWLSCKSQMDKLNIKDNSNEYFERYREIAEMDYSDFIEKRLDSFVDCKVYLKWYTDQQVEVFESSFKTLRDRAIFLCTVDGGMRIDEVLSIKLSDYDGIENTITPSRSKSKELRIIELSKKTCDIINDYIISERADAEVESGKYSDFLFINIRCGEKQGEPLSYNNYYKIFKRYGKKAGFDVEQIRTHSGRSTKVMEYLEHQALYPEDNITDNQIRMNMGWANIESMEPYRDNNNMVIAKSAQSKVQRRKNDRNKEESK